MPSNLTRHWQSRAWDHGMIVYRIARTPFIYKLDGMGSFLYGGRWTSIGTSAIYTAEHRSLAYLEYLVHQFGKDTWPSDLSIASIKIDDGDISTIKKSQISDDWDSLLLSPESQSIGDRAFQEGKTALRIPSVIVPNEFNIILNPRSDHFDSAWQIMDVESLQLDKRFYSSDG